MSSASAHHLRTSVPLLRDDEGLPHELDAGWLLLNPEVSEAVRHDFSAAGLPLSEDPAMTVEGQLEVRRLSPGHHSGANALSRHRAERHAQDCNNSEELHGEEGTEEQEGCRGRVVLRW